MKDEGYTAPGAMQERVLGSGLSEEDALFAHGFNVRTRVPELAQDFFGVFAMKRRHSTRRVLGCLVETGGRSGLSIGAGRRVLELENGFVVLELWVREKLVKAEHGTTGHWTTGPQHD